MMKFAEGEMVQVNFICALFGVESKLSKRIRREEL